MLRHFLKTVSVSRQIIFYTALFVFSCSRDKKDVDVSGIDVSITSERLEKDMVSSLDNISYLQKKYGTFFDLYVWQILNLGTPDTTLLKNRLRDFVSDPDITNVYADASKVHADFSAVDRELTDGFRHYSYYFPGRIVPRVITYISGFNYAIVCADSALGIGLDMYLGTDSRFYPSLELPEYKIRKMSREYIATDALRGWAQSEWEQDPSKMDLISQMVYLGKIQYFLGLMMPETPDSLKFGYTRKQLEWCEASERSIWTFLLDHKLLYATEAGRTGKFVNDGPTTNGFPKESPGNIGAWIGYRIVLAYMDKHSSVSLPQLMDDNDAHRIFRESGYKPAK